LRLQFDDLGEALCQDFLVHQALVLSEAVGERDNNITRCTFLVN
jgi:hypothetical protein